MAGTNTVEQLWLQQARDIITTHPEICVFGELAPGASLYDGLYGGCGAFVYVPGVDKPPLRTEPRPDATAKVFIKKGSKAQFFLHMFTDPWISPANMPRIVLYGSFDYWAFTPDRVNAGGMELFPLPRPFLSSAAMPGWVKVLEDEALAGNKMTQKYLYEYPAACRMCQDAIAAKDYVGAVNAAKLALAIRQELIDYEIARCEQMAGALDLPIGGVRSVFSRIENIRTGNNFYVANGRPEWLIFLPDVYIIGLLQPIRIWKDAYVRAALPSGQITIKVGYHDIAYKLLLMDVSMPLLVIVDEAGFIEMCVEARTELHEQELKKAKALRMGGYMKLAAPVMLAASVLTGGATIELFISTAVDLAKRAMDEGAQNRLVERSRKEAQEMMAAQTGGVVDNEFAGLVAGLVGGQLNAIAPVSPTGPNMLKGTATGQPEGSAGASGASKTWLWALLAAGLIGLGYWYWKKHKKETKR